MFQKRNFGISGTGFWYGLDATKSTVSKHSTVGNIRWLYLYAKSLTAKTARSDDSNYHNRRKKLKTPK